jgi:predicted RNase H-like HicB family nuclease
VAGRAIGRTGGSAATRRDVPGEITEGDAEAPRRGVDAWETVLATYIKDSKPLPRPSRAGSPT